MLFRLMIKDQRINMDLRSFTRLAERLLPRLIDATKSVMSSVGAQQAEDVAQETLMRLWSMRSTLTHVKSVDHLAYTIARHIAIDYARKAGFEAAPFPDNPDWACEAEAESVLRASDSQITASIILASLPPKQALVMRMRHIDGLDDAEISALTGISRSNIRVLVSRARTAARNIISSHSNLF